jgi:endonuclease/exonuclease/phosphatase family metal-dependent hydrolase
MTVAVAGAVAAAPARAASGSLGSTYTLMQMNLCLSGLAGCYRKVEYPAAVEEAIARIRDARPDAVTFNEACGGDVALVARATGYHLRFSREIYYGKPLACSKPGGRGLFGDAVLTQASIESADSQSFQAQAGPEWRQWLCVSTQIGVDVCTAHLASHEAVEVAANAPQCAELGALLARRAAARTVIFGGDLNRRSSCASPGFWTRTDRSARQDPGLQQVYGTPALRSPSARVVPAKHTDHDVLLVSAFLRR